uniref:Uncharacterized protein n=1 Tax=Eutreptiella gymnastica TaxID=73025 RepID=A0A6U7TM13_9EUGL
MLDVNRINVRVHVLLALYLPHFSFWDRPAMMMIMNSSAAPFSAASQKAFSQLAHVDWCYSRAHLICGGLEKGFEPQDTLFVAKFAPCWALRYGAVFPAAPTR